MCTFLREYINVFKYSSGVNINLKEFLRGTCIPPQCGFWMRQYINYSIDKNVLTIFNIVTTLMSKVEPLLMATTL